MWNKKGQVFIYLLMVGVVIFILALAFAPGLASSIGDVRGADGLDCTNATISNFDQATCVVADLTIFYYIAGVIALGGMVIAARKFL